MTAQIAPAPQPILATIAPEASAPRKHRRSLVPLTFEKRMELGAVLSVPATVEDYIFYLNKCDYRLQYSRGRIWSFIEIDEQTDSIMGEAAPIHEQLVCRLTRFLGNLLEDFNSEYRSFGSRIKVYISRFNGYYNPDLAISKGEPVFVKHKAKKKSATSLTNPKLIVEILSKGTEGFDKGNKLDDYQRIESLEQIIFVEPNTTRVTTYNRQSNDIWLNQNFENSDDVLPILNEGNLRVGDIYKNLIRLGG